MADEDGQAKIWLVVPPSFGLPLFLGSVALTAVIVHAGVLGYATWGKKYINGGTAKVAVTQPAPVAPAAPAATPQVK